MMGGECTPVKGLLHSFHLKTETVRIPGSTDWYYTDDTEFMFDTKRNPGKAEETSKTARGTGGGFTKLTF